MGAGMPQTALQRLQGARAGSQPGSLPCHGGLRQRRWRWKYRFDKDFLGTGISSEIRQRPTGASHREALSAAALAFDVRVPEAEGLVQALFHEIDHRPVDELQACEVDEDAHPVVLE